jgi:hypothetical protein
VGALIDDARQAGIESLDLGVRGNNHDAIQRYESLGFLVWGRRPNVVESGDDRYDEVRMSSDAGPPPRAGQRRVPPAHGPVAGRRNPCRTVQPATSRRPGWARRSRSGRCPSRRRLAPSGPRGDKPGIDTQFSLGEESGAVGCTGVVVAEIRKVG